MTKAIIRCLAFCLCATWAALAYAETKTVELDIGGKTALGDLVLPEGASMADGVLLMTHGTLAHKDMELMETLQTALAERGVVSLAHSLTLGQDKREGMYDCKQPHRHAHEDAVREIGAWVKWLGDNGAKRISVLGHSRGGNQVAWYAAGQDGFEKIVLLAPTTGGSFEKAAATYKSRFKAELAPIYTKAAELAEQGKEDEMLDVPGFIYCPEGKASAQSVVSYYAPNPKRATQAHVTSIGTPVLVIAASSDTVIPDVEEKFNSVVDGEKVRLEMVQDAGHMFLEFYAEDAADLIAEFLQE